MDYHTNSSQHHPFHIPREQEPFPGAANILENMDTFTEIRPGVWYDPVDNVYFASSSGQQPLQQRRSPPNPAMNFPYIHNMGMGMGQVAMSPIHGVSVDSFGRSHSTERLQQPQWQDTLPDDLGFYLSSLSPGNTLPTSNSEWDIDFTASIPTYQACRRSLNEASASYNPLHARPLSRRGSLNFEFDIKRLLSPVSTSPVDPGPLVEHDLTAFLPHQQEAAQKVYDYMLAHPNAAIPWSLITSELAEVEESRGWCLIGDCGIDRAVQRANPHYDTTKDALRKDDLYDHIGQNHFNYRPFRCSMAPSCRLAFVHERDLERHEVTHRPMSRPCDICDKVYTRDDNLKRHIQRKHPGATMSLPEMSHVSDFPPFPASP